MTQRTESRICTARSDMTATPALVHRPGPCRASGFDALNEGAMCVAHSHESFGRSRDKKAVHCTGMRTQTSQTRQQLHDRLSSGIGLLSKEIKTTARNEGQSFEIGHLAATVGRCEVPTPQSQTVEAKTLHGEQKQAWSRPTQGSCIGKCHNTLPAPQRGMPKTLS
jgi:hypothetical protein